jgi:hypothetical protein
MFITLALWTKKKLPKGQLSFVSKNNRISCFQPFLQKHTSTYVHLLPLIQIGYR